MLGQGVCECCGHLGGVVYVEALVGDEATVALCAVCHSADMQQLLLPPGGQRGLGRAFVAAARLANAMIDGHGPHYRAQVEARLLGVEPPTGEYDAL